MNVHLLLYCLIAPMVQDLQTYIVLLEVHLNALMILMLIQQTATERIHMRVWSCRAICCMEQRVKVVLRVAAPYLELLRRS